MSIVTMMNQRNPGSVEKSVSACCCSLLLALYLSIVTYILQVSYVILASVILPLCKLPNNRVKQVTS